MKAPPGFALAAVIVLGLSGCGKGTGSERTDGPSQATVPADGKEFTLQQGQSVRLGGTRSTLQF
ncbi:MAG: hypothetical protein ABI836_07220, partial [Gemmatimonadota bacterium]